MVSIPTIPSHGIYQRQFAALGPGQNSFKAYNIAVVSLPPPTKPRLSLSSVVWTENSLTSP